MGKLEPQQHGGALYRPDKGESGNPAGPAPGYKHISTWIQDMMNDEEFETTMLDSKMGTIEYKGAPLKAIIKVAIFKAIHDKDKGNIWAEWLAKHGWGSKLDITSGGEKLNIALVEFVNSGDNENSDKTG